MNVIYIHPQDIGDFVQPYGYGVSTPNIMKLAQQGTLFRRAYCAAPTCSPSRSAMLTGMCAHSCGMMGLAHRGFSMSDYSRHIARFFNKNGYETVLCGIQHESSRALKNELLQYQLDIDGTPPYDSMEEEDLQNTRRAVEYLRRPKDKPFFLSFGLRNAHRDYPQHSKSVNPDYLMPPFPVYDNNITRNDLADFISSLQIADNCIGEIMTVLEETGLSEDTFIFFTTDHGIDFPEMKCTLYDTGIKVALIIKYPGNRTAGKATDTLVSQIDIFPTICDILGIEKPQWLQGVSILPVLEGKSDKIRDEIFAEINYHAAYEPSRCIRTERYKLIKRYIDYKPMANIGWSPTKDFLAESGIMNETVLQDMLFDLYLDPVERINRVNDPRYKKTYADLEQRLVKWMNATNDPLLAGYVEKPEGAVVQSKTALSPREKNYE